MSRAEEEDGNSEDESDHDGRALPIRPLGGHSRLSGSGFGTMSSSSSSPPAPPSRPPPPPQRAVPPPSNPIPAGPSASSERLTPSVSVSGSEEILDEEEGG
ncbi:hypothetical protein CPC08DRAFT_217753 [Agrocybe pediades]|nr:hypothetical protein CPC08DRAFT_217753 [Agrocybe pediades]